MASGSSEGRHEARPPQPAQSPAAKGPDLGNSGSHVRLLERIVRWSRTSVEQASFLIDLSTIFNDFDLASHFIVDSLLDKAQGIQILGLGTRAERATWPPQDLHVGAGDPSSMLPSQVPVPQD